MNPFFKKNTLLIICTILFIALIHSCNVSKNSIQLKLNDIDSAIRVVIPSHNCGCNWQNKESNIYMIPILKKYGYAWQAIFVKSLDSVDVVNDSKKVFQQLIKLDSRYGDFKRFFLEYRIPEKNDSLNFKVIGTWYHYYDGCNGYISGTDVKKLEKKSALDSYKKQLCK